MKGDTPFSILSKEDHDIHFIHEKKFFKLTHMATLYPAREYWILKREESDENLKPNCVKRGENAN